MEDNAQISYRRNNQTQWRSSTDQTNNQNSGPGVAEIISSSSKKLKDKIRNFFYERKGYKRVNTTNAAAGLFHFCVLTRRRRCRAR